MVAKNYKDLNIWQKSMEIINDVYGVTKKFPKEEMFGIVTQMRRSAISIASNIAEGFMRQHGGEYKQFLYIALGSCAELETQVIAAFNQDYLTEDMKERLLEKLDHESRMLMNMIKSVVRSLTRQLSVPNERRTTNDERRFM